MKGAIPTLLVCGGLLAMSYGPSVWRWLIKWTHRARERAKENE